MEDFGVEVPLELTFVGLAGPDQVEGVPADLVVVAQVLQDDVLATTDQVCVLDRTSGADLFGNDVDPAGFERVVAKRNFDRTPIGEPQHKQQEANCSADCRHPESYGFDRLSGISLFDRHVLYLRAALVGAVAL